jgi:hypothetical protein
VRPSPFLLLFRTYAYLVAEIKDDDEDEGDVSSQTLLEILNEQENGEYNSDDDEDFDADAHAAEENEDDHVIHSDEVDSDADNEGAAYPFLVSWFSCLFLIAFLGVPTMKARTRRRKSLNPKSCQVPPPN